MEINLRINEQILKSDKVICRHIDNIGTTSRGEVSQDILAQLRHFVEHIMLKVYANGNDIEDSQENIKRAVKFTKSNTELTDISRFHHYLQVSVSHRTLEEENSERLMLKYYEYLFKIRKFLKEKYSMEVLHNLENFPLEVDETLKEYYEKIAEKIDAYNTPIKSGFRFDRFYIQNMKSFFINGKIYYEIAFVPANDKSSKTDRIIAFTDIELTSNYAVKLAIADDAIEIFDKKMPIRVIVDWEVSIRPCEYANFGRLITNVYSKPGQAEQKNIAAFLTRTRLSLSELILLDSEAFERVRDRIVPKSEGKYFFDILEVCRDFVINRKNGCNILMYLLFHMNNRVIKAQYQEHWKWDYEECRKVYIGGNYRLSNLYIAYESIPFDEMPFCSNLKRHVPNLADLFDCLDSRGREYELLARLIKNNTEQKGILFTPLTRDEDSGKYFLGGFYDVEELVAQHNNQLYHSEKQQARKLIIDKGYIFIEGYKNDTVSIIKSIIDMSKEGLPNYSNTVRHWINTQDRSDVSEEKKEALINMFEKSKVSVIYGAAGTGKTTMISYISTFFKDKSILYLAHTNPAVNNLKRKVLASSNSNFMTIAKFNNKRSENLKRDYDIVVIDECSTVSNRSMCELLDLVKCKLLILVGDTYQIESIEFGNWFDSIRSFLPKTSIVELKTPFRSNNTQLLGLWENVRKMSDDIYDRLVAGEYSANLDSSIFKPAAENEIILCLNYGGLYGINNINHFMQENNTGKEIMKGIQRYKVGDPILFNDAADGFFNSEAQSVPMIHNNMKGHIIDFKFLNKDMANESIQFDIELDRPLLSLDTENLNFEIIGTTSDGNSIIRFEVYKNKSTDEDDDNVSKSVVPFQISYAVGIHKAQGLEYDSVKIVITDEIDELISHSIFYTAITRAKKSLKIYWTQKVEKKILTRLSPINHHQDVSLLKSEILRDVM